MLAVRGSHLRRISELKAMKDITYQYTEVQSREQLILSEGVMTDVRELLPKLRTPVVWCAKRQAVKKIELSLEKTATRGMHV